jgi:hypothetical protein
MQFSEKVLTDTAQIKYNSIKVYNCHKSIINISSIRNSAYSKTKNIDKVAVRTSQLVDKFYEKMVFVTTSKEKDFRGGKSISFFCIVLEFYIPDLTKFKGLYSNKSFLNTYNEVNKLLIK